MIVHPLEKDIDCVFSSIIAHTESKPLEYFNVKTLYENYLYLNSEQDDKNTQYSLPYIIIFNAQCMHTLI